MTQVKIIEETNINDMQVAINELLKKESFWSLHGELVVCPAGDTTRRYIQVLTCNKGGYNA